METLSKQEQMGLFEKLGHKIDALVTAMTKKEEKPKAKVIVKPKNSLELTLTDGTVLTCEAEDPNNLQGAKVAKQDGSPLDDGTYETAEGLEIDVVGGVITDAEQEPTNEDEPTMETADSLKAQIDALQTKMDALVSKAPAAKAKTEFKAKVEDQSKFDAKILELENTIAELKKQTVGSAKPPKVAPVEEEIEATEEEAAFMNHVVGFYEGRGFLKRVS